MSVNCDRVCRLCLSSRGELLPIFPTTSSDGSGPPALASRIQACVSVQINQDDELPTRVCRKCLDNVNNWHIFKKICERSQSKLSIQNLQSKQNLMKAKDGSLLEENIKIKSEPMSDEAYDDAVVIDASYPGFEQNGTSSKMQPEGPPILASLGLTPRSDKGAETEKEDEDDEDDENLDETVGFPKLATMPEVSVTVMRPTGETLHARQGIQQLASKDCLVCGRAYRYSHNARRHELTSHSFDRYTNKTTSKKSHHHPKLRPNPFNPKARLMPNPINSKIKRMPKTMSGKIISANMSITRSSSKQHNLPYPLRIKALKDLQVKKKEPQILKTLLTSKPEVVVSEPEIATSRPESPETLISEPEIASFYPAETIISEPEVLMNEQDGEVEGEEEDQQNNHTNYDTVDMESDHEIEIARQQDASVDNSEKDKNSVHENDADLLFDNDEEAEEISEENNDDIDKANQESEKKQAEDKDNDEDSLQVVENGMKIDEETADPDLVPDIEDNGDEEDDEMPPMVIAPIVEINEDPHTNSYTSENNEEEEEDVSEINETGEEIEPAKVLDPSKQYLTKTQRDFIMKHRNIIEQINTKRCLCCDREYPRRKAVIQHLQKNGHKVPKHTCYNCVVTFGHIGALLSHMRANVCTDLWKLIYQDDGIPEDLIIEDGPKFNKVQYKDILNSRSYACKLCPAKFQLKQFIMKHVLDVHEDGQSRVPLACVHCGYRFKENRLWKKHIRNGECTVHIACDLCPEKFVTILDFNDHALAVHAGSLDQSNDGQSKHVDGRPTDCPICKKSHSNYHNLVKHLKSIHNDETPHYCQHCDSKFGLISDLNQHIYLEHSDRSLGNQETPDTSVVKEEAEEYHYSCTECNSIFETVDAWTDHQVAEHNQIAHHCDQCEKKFLRPSELAEHKNTHLRVKFYSCSVCSNSYSTPQKLSEHVQQVHPDVAAISTSPTSEFFCEMCSRSFKSRQAYSNHMRIHSKVPTTNRKPGDPNKGFIPPIIGKPIKQLPQMQVSNFAQFKPTYNIPNAPYSCDICGKGFMHKKNIWKHKKVLHADLIGDRNDSEENTMQASTEGEEEYNNEENGIGLSIPQFNSFNFSNYTTNNVQTPAVQPEGGLPYSCEMCMKKFPLRSSLWKHKRAKHGIINASANTTEPNSAPGEGGRSSCTICKITFSDKKSYYRHRKNVHKSNVQMCKICGKPLNSTLELYEHLKAAHARELLGYNANQGAAKLQDTQAGADYEYGGDDHDTTEPGSEYQAHYPCDTCGKQFVGLLALQNHQCLNQTSSQASTFDCEICHKSYTSISALKSHRGWHLRSPDGKAAANNSGLWMPQHKVTSKISKHEVLDATPLVQFQQATPTAAAAKRRLPPEVEVTVVNPNKKLRSEDSEIDMPSASQNLGSEVDDRYCALCDKEFTKRAAYQRHMDEVHRPNSVFCPVCDKSFTRKSTLLVHMRKHYEGADSGMSSLGMVAASQVSAELDVEVHACDLCGAQYRSSKALRVHRARHHGEDSADSEEEAAAAAPPAAPGEFTCGQCGDGVATPRDLLAHRTMHATPTKFFCHICKVYFPRALDLSSHTRARHADNDKVFFPCAMCDRFYMNKKSLQRHIETAH